VQEALENFGLMKKTKRLDTPDDDFKPTKKTREHESMAQELMERRKRL